MKLGKELTMEPQADIGVVIALYQGQLHIKETLGSILCQNVLPTEVIVVDDGSTDNGKMTVSSLISEFADYGITLTLISKENGGQGSARNMGVEQLSTQFVAFLDQDDLWGEGHLENLLNVIENSPNSDLGWVYSDFNEVDEFSRTIRRNFLAQGKYKVPKHDVFSMLGQDLMMLPSASLINVDAFREVHGFDTQFRGYEDDDLFVRLFMRGWNFEFTSASNVGYRIHAGNSSGGTSFLQSRLKFFRKMNEIFPPSSQYSELLLHKFLGPRILNSYLLDGYAATRRRDWVFLREVSLNYKLAIKEFETKNSIKNSVKQKFILSILRNKYLALPVFRVYGAVASMKTRNKSSN